MAQESKASQLDASTEELIKQAAKKVFHEKGYAATRTRDIVEEAGLNLALLNYYFRSKEKLFGLIMTETLEHFFYSLSTALNDTQTSLDQKINILVSKYIDLLLEEPNIPIFILSEARNNSELLFQKIKVKDTLMNSSFFKQYKEAVIEGSITEENPLHFLSNLMGLVIFPFLGKPILNHVGDIKEDEFKTLMQVRKKKIPIWIKAMFS